MVVGRSRALCRATRYSARSCGSARTPVRSQHVLEHDDHLLVQLRAPRTRCQLQEFAKSAVLVCSPSPWRLWRWIGGPPRRASTGPAATPQRSSTQLESWHGRAPRHRARKELCFTCRPPQLDGRLLGVSAGPHDRVVILQVPGATMHQPQLSHPQPSPAAALSPRAPDSSSTT